MSFPSNPSIGNTYSVDQRSWQWNGYAWEKYDTTPNEVYSINGITGAIGLSAGFGITLTASGKTFTIATKFIMEIGTVISKLRGQIIQLGFYMIL